MKHTKGPWIMEASDIFSSDGSKDRVAQVNPDLGNPDWVYDAQLIAAAPELLGALETAKDTLDGILEHECKQDPDSNEVHHLQEVLMEVNEAIAKARGE